MQSFVGKIPNQLALVIEHFHTDAMAGNEFLLKNCGVLQHTAKLSASLGIVVDNDGPNLFDVILGKNLTRNRLKDDRKSIARRNKILRANQNALGNGNMQAGSNLQGQRLIERGAERQI
jgi:hypothetical protein